MFTVPETTISNPSFSCKVICLRICCKFWSLSQNESINLIQRESINQHYHISGQTPSTLPYQLVIAHKS